MVAPLRLQQDSVRGQALAIIDVQAQECPQLPLRVMGLISQQAIVAERFECVRSEGTLSMQIAVSGWSEQFAKIAANKMRGLIGGAEVHLEFHG